MMYAITLTIPDCCKFPFAASCCLAAAAAAADLAAFFLFFLSVLFVFPGAGSHLDVADLTLIASGVGAVTAAPVVVLPVVVVMFAAAPPADALWVGLSVAVMVSALLMVGAAVGDVMRLLWY